MVSPPPCFYVSTQCVPRIVLDETLDNGDTRSWEDEHHNEDEKFLHEPVLDIANVTEWRLVSGRVARDSPLGWNYNDGLVMSEFTSPVDNRPYHRVCTFALVSTKYQKFESGVEYGFSIAEDKGKADHGPTQAAQNSYGAPNHVYDAGHVFPGREMWQRSFGETVAPRLNDTCSGVRAGKWRNRLYRPAQQFNSESYVFGTCARNCDEVAALDIEPVEASLGGPQLRRPARSRASQSRLHDEYYHKDKQAYPGFGAAAAAALNVAAPPTPGAMGLAAAAVAAVALVAAGVVFRRKMVSQESEATKSERISLLSAARPVATRWGADV